MNILSRTEVLAQIINDLKLSDYYPSKLGREEVYTITEYSLAENLSSKPEELSLYYLSNLLALNHQARWLKTEKNIEQTFFVDEDNWLLQNNDKTSQANSQDIHPLDVMAATFLCCESIIRQDLVLKMWECKLAVPLVIQESEERAPKFFLWAMRGLVMKWKKIEGETICSEERTIADYRMNTVSFIRLDRSEVSKSDLINAVMFGSNPHDIFFHRNSEASNENRQLAEGSVEIAWYLPEANDDNSFDDITAFMNLRGDARRYPQQLKLIEQISSHVVIFISIEQLEGIAIRIVSELLDSGKAVILLLTNKEISSENRGKFQKFMENFQNKSISFISLLNPDKSLKSKPEIRDGVRNKLRTSSPVNLRLSLEEVVRVAEQQGMEVDEQEVHCQQGIKQATEILNLVRQHPKEQRKAELLPLQNKCWKEWAEADKEAVWHRRNYLKEDSGEYSNKQNQRKADSQRQQIEMIREGRLPQITQLLLKGLFQEEREGREYFVRQLKIGLDALSRMELPDLYDKYGQKMKELGQFQSSPKVNEIDPQREQEVQARGKINQELKEIDQQITEQSFGLEHLLREVGQVYIALKGIESRNEVEQLQYEKLPQIAAELLLSGYPLEIMDGEVSSVPINWVQAVLAAFTELVQKQGIENPKIFALSAMGIQSSGKSTLLNVMFGLQFAVSAGRCTKEIYLQPVKLSPELREELQVDYIFVIDTEGIKSPEQSLDIESGHDNELSTFTIGLSDLSLIKVSGENSTYLQDMLPISVQAFLRMREVNLKPKTKIIHRNVDTSSTEKLDRQNVTLNTSLDKYTKLACLSEKQPVRAFNKIIEFNLKDDVRYLNNLYQGIASRSPIDSQYSKSVKNLTREIVYGITPKNISSIDRFSLHLKTLWNAVKNENFVYEFKNTMEIQARNKLNTFWSQVVREFGEQVANLVERVYTDINSCDSKDNLSIIINRYKEGLSALVDANWLAQKQEIEKFFEESEGQYENSMNKWQANTIINLDDLRNRLRQDAEQQIQSYQASREAELAHRDSLSTYRDQIIEAITDFINKQKQAKSEQDLLEIPEQELKNEFEKIWQFFLDNIKPPNLPPASVSKDIERILVDSYSDVNGSIIARKNKSLKKYLREYFIQDFKITRVHYCQSIVDRVVSSIEDVLIEDTTKIFEQEINNLKDSLLNQLISELELKVDNLIPYDANYMNQFLDRADKQFNEKSKKLQEKLNYPLTRECQADLFMILCGEAIRRLEKIDSNWRNAQNPKIAMQKKKEEFWEFFLIGFSRVNLHTAVVGNLLSIIQEGIIKKIATDFPKIVTKKFLQVSKYSKIFNDKQSLIVSKMIDLAEHENFNDYIKYISTPKTAFEEWIERNFDEYNQAIKIKYILEESIDDLVEKAEDLIKKTNNDSVSGEKITILDWIEKFKRINSKSTPGENSFISDWMSRIKKVKENILIIDNLERIEQLCSQSSNKDSFIFPEIEINQTLQNMKQMILTTDPIRNYSIAGTHEYIKVRNFATKNIIDSVLGCVEACPFCGEICYSQAEKHESHATLNGIHRPHGLKYYYIGSRKLITDTCSQKVAGDGQFLDDKTGGNFLPYKQYRKVYPQWDIKGDASLEAGAYWKWFMTKYSEQLAIFYDVEQPDIPPSWRSITKPQVIESLCQIFDGKG